MAIRDTIMFFIIVVFVMAIFLLFRNDAFTSSSDRFFATALLFLLYGIAALSVAYILSFVFESGMAAQLGIAAVTFVLGFGLVLTSFILDCTVSIYLFSLIILAIENTKDANKILKHFYRIFPPYLFGEGLININSVEITDTYMGTYTNRFDWDCTGRAMLWLPVETVVCILITLAIDSGILSRVFYFCYKPIRAKLWQFKLKRTQVKPQKSGVELVRTSSSIFKSQSLTLSVEGDTSVQDPDVIAERSRVSSEVANIKDGNADAVIVHQLTKIYPARGGGPPKVAVAGISLGIPKGECFGFLGTNGAGKTTVHHLVVMIING